jgi:serine/threonine-protein kinase
MAPERIDGKTPDARADVFSLGAVLYEMLTGRRCFGGKDLVTIVKKVYNEDPVPPSEIQAGLPKDTDAVVARALAKDPAHRYATARAFAEDLLAAARPLAGDQAKVGSRANPGRAEPIGSPGLALFETTEATIRSGSVPGLALPAGKRVSLAVLEGARQGQRFVMRKPRFVLGREGGGVPGRGRRAREPRRVPPRTDALHAHRD